MGFSGDTRGQSLWIGAVLLLGVLLLNLALYQSTIVPQQNAEVEFDHAAEMESAMRQLKDVVYLLGHTGGTQTVSLDLGPDYPPRLLALNPPPPSGSLRTTTTGTMSLFVDGTATNLTKACGYGGHAIETRSLTYTIEYNSYAASPRLTYSQTALYKTADGTQLLLSDEQSLVTNDTISLIPITGNYSETSTTPVSLELVGGPVGRTQVSPNQSVRLRFPSRLNASLWRDLLADQTAVTEVVQAGEHRIAVGLAPNRTYSVVCYPLGVEQAPPTGVRTLGTATVPTSGNETTTATPTPTPTRDTQPNGTIEQVSASRERRGSTFHTNVTVDWSATDADGDLDSVTVTITDMNTSKTKSKTYNVSGQSAADRYTALFGVGKAEEGDTYEIVLLTTDQRGNQERERVVVQLQ